MLIDMVINNNLKMLSAALEEAKIRCVFLGVSSQIFAVPETFIS